MTSQMKDLYDSLSAVTPTDIQSMTQEEVNRVIDLMNMLGDLMEYLGVAEIG